MVYLDKFSGSKQKPRRKLKCDMLLVGEEELALGGKIEKKTYIYTIALSKSLYRSKLIISP